VCRLKLDNCIALGWVHIYRDTPHKNPRGGGCARGGGQTAWGRGRGRGQGGGSDRQGQWCKETLVNRSRHPG
jgi:hypothetical protein